MIKSETIKYYELEMTNLFLNKFSRVLSDLQFAKDIFFFVFVCLFVY